MKLRLRALLGALLLLAGGVGLVLHAQSYLPFFVDDAFISLRYAERLAEGRGLTFNDGEAVEGYTNFLWVVLLAVSKLLGAGDLVQAARELGVACMLGVLGAIVWMERKPRLTDWIAPVFGVLLLAMAGPIAAWSIGGLEQPLLAVSVAWGFVLLLAQLDRDELSVRELWPSGACFAIAALTRPDGILFGGAAVLGLLLARLPSGFRRPAGVLREGVLLLAVPLACVAAHIAFRRIYYQAWVPNTYHAKVAWTSGRIDLGLRYVFEWGKPLWPVLLMAALAIPAAVFDRGRRARVIVLLPALLIWITYVVGVGGDIMPQRRHLIVPLVLAVLLGMQGISWLAGRSRLSTGVAAGVAALCSALFVWTQRGDWQKDVALRDTWHWPGRPIGYFFQEAFGDQHPLLAVDAAGALPYYSRLRVLDMLGLNDPWLPHHPPPGFGTGPLAHELGDGHYFLRRKPDLVVFHHPTGRRTAEWRGGREMQRQPEFPRDYQLVTFELPPPEPYRVVTWVRREGRLGISRNDEAIRVPGYLFGDNPKTLARMDADGWVGADVSLEAPARYRELPVPAGRYRVRVQGRGELLIRVLTTQGIIASGIGETELLVPRNTPHVLMEISLPWGEQARLREVVLTRVP